MIYPQHDELCKDYPDLSAKEVLLAPESMSSYTPHPQEVIPETESTTAEFLAQNLLFEFISVARVQPRTSKGITDLLLPHFLLLVTNSPSKK